MTLAGRYTRVDSLPALETTGWGTRVLPAGAGLWKDGHFRDVVPPGWVIRGTLLIGDLIVVDNLPATFLDGVVPTVRRMVNPGADVIVNGRRV